MTPDAARLITSYGPPSERSLRKQLARLERHSRRFIELSPFLVLATGSIDGQYDASPRGGAPGFVKVASDTELLIPDAPGNNRLDSLRNIAQSAAAGLIFFIPGIDETLRINGGASLSDAPAHLAAFEGEPRMPRCVIVVEVREVYLHCAKALMRSKLWDPAARHDRSVLPSMGRMINDQSGVDAPAESQEAMLERYRRDL